MGRRANTPFAARRRASGLTQEQLAQLAQVSQSLISDMEQGNRVKETLAARVFEAIERWEAQKAQNSSAGNAPAVSSGQTEQPRSTDGTMQALRLVPPIQIRADARALSALDRAFDGRRHRLEDAWAVRQILHRLPVAAIEEPALTPFLVDVLDAAARVRDRHEEITEGSLLVEVWRSRA